ncbi:hypothetical protein STEG23_003824 [Scotinomys teguina]
MTVTPLGRDQDCSLKIREPEVPAPWFLDPGGWSKTAAVSLYFIFPGICTLSLYSIAMKRHHGHTNSRVSEKFSRCSIIQISFKAPGSEDEAS